MRLQGWLLTGWIALALLGLFAGVLAAAGWSEEGVRAVVRTSARTSALLFALAFSASSLRVFWRSPASAWLLANRRYLGVSFAVSHFAHLVALLAWANCFPETFRTGLATPAGVVLTVGYVFLAAMTATSFDRSAAWLGPSRWKLLHTTGGYVLWLAFAGAYLQRTLANALNAPFALLLLGVIGLRIARRWRRPGAGAR